MLHQELEARVDKLRAMTVDRGASPAEAATAAALALRLISRIGYRGAAGPPTLAGRHSMLAPGVHVEIVSLRGLGPLVGVRG